MLQVERQIQIVDENYYSVNEALEILNISRATLYAKINANELLSKKVDKRRFVYIDEEVKLKYLSDYFDDCSTEQSSHTTEQSNHTTGQSDHTAEQSGHTTEHAEDGRLLDEIEYFKSKTIALEEELAKVRMEREKVINQKEEASKRHDTIVMQLSGTINDTQFQLQEARKLNFIQRIFDFF